MPTPTTANATQDVSPVDDSGSEVPAGAELAVEVRGLDFSYTEGSFALRDVTFAVPAGETVALVGRTGSGKSTLASFVSRAIEPPRGTVFVGGVDVRDLDVQLLRTDVGVVTQRTEIIAGTLADNIALFDDTPRSDIEAAVVELGLVDWVAGLPDGLETLLGPGGTTLSAGEEQLVAFARLLVRDVRVVRPDPCVFFSRRSYSCWAFLSAAACALSIAACGSICRSVSSLSGTILLISCEVRNPSKKWINGTRALRVAVCEISAKSCASCTLLAHSMAQPVWRTAITSEWSPKIDSAL